MRCGGGVNHRRGLDDAVLIKDNHVAAAGGVGAALDAVWAAHPRGSIVVQVEVDDLDQLDEALAHGAPADPARQLRRRAVPRGGRPDPIASARGASSRPAAGSRSTSRAAYAATGVDFLAVGALTHSAPSLDIGLDTV